MRSRRLLSDLDQACACSSPRFRGPLEQMPTIGECFWTTVYIDGGSSRSIDVEGRPYRDDGAISARICFC